MPSHPASGSPDPDASPAPGLTARLRLSRHAGVRILIVIGAVLLVASLVAVWAYRSFFESDGFTSRAMAALDEPVVERRLAEIVAPRMSEGRPRLEAAEPVLAAVVEWVIASSRFRAVLEEAAGLLHAQVLFEADAEELALRLRGITDRVREVLLAVAPDLAAELPQTDAIEAKLASGSDLRADLLHLAETVGFLAFVLPVLTIAAFAAAVFVSRERGRAVLDAAIAAGVVAVLVLLALLIGRILLLDAADAEDDEAVKAVWEAFTGGLQDAAWLLLALAAAVAVWHWYRYRKTEDAD